MNADETETDREADDSDGVTRLQLASWDARFWAWLVDVILVGAALSAIGEATGLFALVTGSVSLTTPFVGVNGVALWLYWTAMEGSRGQSAGKIVLNVAVVDEAGGDIGYATAAVESFGKAFILPLDLVIGWFAMEGEYRRLFNRLSGTIVVAVPEDDRAPEGVEYVPPE